MKISSEQSR